MRFAVLLAAILLNGCAVSQRIGGVLGESANALMGRAQMSVGTSFLIVQGDSGKWGYVTHPVCWRISEKRLGLSYHLIGDGPNYSENAPADWPAYSDDNGTSWVFGDPFLWMTEPVGRNTFVKKGEFVRHHFFGYHGGVFHLKDGRHYMHYVSDETVHDQHIVQGIWSGDGTVWQGPEDVQIDVPPGTRSLYFMPDGKELSDGSLVMVADAHFQKDVDKWRSILLRSFNGGHSFQYFTTLGAPEDAPWGGEGPNESTFVVLTNDTWVAISRTGCSENTYFISTSDPLLLSRSSDGGKTWQHHKMDFSGVWPQMVRMSNGLLVCVTGRPGVYLLVSEDDGLSWRLARWIIPATTPTSGYASILEVSPGRLLVVYDRHFEKSNAVYGVFVDVSRS